MTYRQTVRAAVLFWICLASACVGSPNAPTHFAEFSQVDLVVGTGDQAGSGLRVVVHYAGWLHDATKPDGKGGQFDSSIGLDPLSFIIGSGSTIRGFESGVSGMREGGRRRLFIPPSFGYGDSRVAQVPPNATLVFEVELLDVE
jgi:FKBP-type peptidyl-prolyl cis-trans isomerase FkpA